MTDDKRAPIPGTYGAIVRSETPMPWRRMLDMVTFTEEELARHLADGTFIEEQICRANAAMALRP